MTDMATVLDALAESGKKGGKEARDKYSKMNTTMQHKLQKKLHSAYGEDVEAVSNSDIKKNIARGTTDPGY